MFAGNASQQILQFLTFIFLARQLAPEIFGQVALASVVIDVGAVLGTWGLVQFMVQRAAVSPKLQAHAFVLSILVAVSICAIILAGCGVYILLYGYGLIAHLILLLTPVILIQGLGLVPDAIIQRRLEFKWLAVRNNMAALLGGACALYLAYEGHGVYALVVQKLVALTMLTTTVWLAAAKDIKILPWAEYKWSTLVLISKQCLRILSNPISTLLGFRAMDALVGLYLGTAVLGQFKIAWRIYDLLVQLTLSPFNSVAYAAFPKLMPDKAALYDFYKSLHTFSLAVIVPMMIGLAYTGSKWVPLILGEQWMGIVPMFHVLCLTAVQVIVTTYQHSLQLAFKWNHFILKQNIFRLVVSVAMTLIGAQISIYAVLFLYAVQTYGFCIYNYYKINKAQSWPLRDAPGLIAPSVISTMLMLAALYAFDYYVPLEPLFALIANIALGGAVYAAAFILFFRPALHTIHKLAVGTGLQK